MPVKETIKAPGGALYLFRAARIIISDMAILRLALAPLFINTIVFVAFFFSFNWFVYDWVYSSVFMIGDMPWYWDALYFLLGAVLFILSIAVVFFGFVAIGLIIAAPFNDLLSAAVEQKLTGKVVASSMNVWESALFVMKNESRKIAIILSIQIVLALLTFVPIIGPIIFFVVSPVFVSVVMAYEFTGYPLDRRGFSYQDKKDYLYGRPGISLGFGLAVAATLIIPIINFALLPLAVTGGTMLVVENRPDLSEPM